MIAQLKRNGIHFATVTLHVGLDTFAPVNEGNPQEHKIHTEWCQVTAGTADRINQVKNKGGRVIAVGTTSVRTLESAAVDGKLQAFEGSTNLFILPGYKFQNNRWDDHKFSSATFDPDHAGECISGS